MKTWSDGEAEIVRHLLESYEIPCQVVSDVTHALLPIAVDGLGEVRIFVLESSFEEASELIADHRRLGPDSLAGGRDADGGGEAEDPTGEHDPGESR
jgi:hypothetical protein